MTEQKLQTEITKWLRQKGCYVIKLNATAGVPVGAPDVLALKDGFWVALEIKASKTAHKQPLQQETIDKLDEWSYAKFVWPDNWPLIQSELERML